MNFNFNPFPVLETERLLLRQLNLDDTKTIFGLRTNNEINTFISRKTPKNLAETRAFIDLLLDLISSNSGILWGIQSKKHTELIGTIGLRNFTVEDHYAEIGYELHPDFHENGFMSEALEKAIHFGFQNLNLKTIEAFTHKNNIASIALLEKYKFILQPEKREMGFDDNRIYRLEH